MVVLPSAISPAMTSDTEARRSVAITWAPRRLLTPLTMAVSPCSWMSAPSRASSCTCMKRFSKMVSRITLVPSALVISAISCACRSVGKPGKGWVSMVIGSSAPPLRETRTPVAVSVTPTPVFSRAANAVSSRLLRAPLSSTSPPAAATAKA